MTRRKIFHSKFEQAKNFKIKTCEQNFKFKFQFFRKKLNSKSDLQVMFLLQNLIFQKCYFKLWQEAKL